jgi:hypothetical protein
MEVEVDTEVALFARRSSQRLWLQKLTHQRGMSYDPK